MAYTVVVRRSDRIDPSAPDEVPLKVELHAPDELPLDDAREGEIVEAFKAGDLPGEGSPVGYGEAMEPATAHRGTFSWFKAVLRHLEDRGYHCKVIADGD